METSSSPELNDMELYRRLFEVSRDAVFIFNLNGECQNANPAAVAITGRTVDELRAMTVRDLLNVDALPSDRRAWHETSPVAAQLRHRDGHDLPVMWQTTPIPLPDGETQVLGIARDISERKRMESSLRQLRERLTKVQQVARMGFLEWNLETDEIVMSAGLYDMYGVKKEEVETTPELVAKAVHPDDMAFVQQQLALAIRGEKPYDVEHRILRPDGSILWTHSQAELQRDEAGNPRILWGTSVDITERKESVAVMHRYAEEATTLNVVSRTVSASLQLEEVMTAAIEAVAKMLHTDMALIFLQEDNRLRLLAESSWQEKYRHKVTPLHRLGQCLCGLSAQQNEALYSADIHKDLRCTWEECKKAGMRSFAALPLASGGEVIGVLGLASAKERDFSVRAEFLETLADTIATGLKNALLHRQIQQHAAELEERVAKRTAELEERSAETEKLNQAMLAMLEDLQTANARYVRVTQKLQKANRELETFTHSVSHDLKAPLRGIDGYSRLLLADYADKLDEDGQYFLRTIRAATIQMNQLIDDLLTYSRLEQRATQNEATRLREFVDTILQHHLDDIQTAGGEVSNTVPDITISTDPMGLEMAIRNVLTNALKFARKDSPPRIEISGHETENGCIITVKDNGIGFDMKFHDRIFGIFQRLHRSEDYPGTGVGLAIVRKAMTRLGGRVWAESSPGEGATFFLEIPRWRDGT